MSTRLQTVGPADPLEDAERIMESRRVRQLVVVDDEDHLLGLLSYRALLRTFVARPEALEKGVTVEELMDRDPVTVTADTPLRDAIRLMLDRDVSAVPVLGDDRRVVGIVSEHDVARLLGTLLEGPGGEQGTPAPPGAGQGATSPESP